MTMNNWTVFLMIPGEQEFIRLPLSEAACEKDGVRLALTVKKFGDISLYEKACPLSRIIMKSTAERRMFSAF